VGATFFLGTHQPGWLGHARIPLFVSDVRLRVYKTLPRAAAPWALDSGGFSELQNHGRWTVGPREYVARVRRPRAARRAVRLLPPLTARRTTRPCPRARTRARGHARISPLPLPIGGP
jgi:hypothetical protein